MITSEEYLVEQLNAVCENGLELEEEFIEKLIFLWADFMGDSEHMIDEDIARVWRENVAPNSGDVSSLVKMVANDIDAQSEF